MTDEARFRALYEAHVGSLVRYALRCSGSLDDAADVVAETFLVAWRRLNDVPDEPAARLWLYGVARRVLANLGRGAARRERLGVRLAGELRTTAGTQFESVVHDGATLKAALARVDPKDRELLTLTSWEGLTPADIATITGIRVGTVRTRLARARNRLRNELVAIGWSPDESDPVVHVDGDGRSLVAESEERC